LVACKHQSLNLILPVRVMTTKRHHSGKQWIVIILVVLALHAILLITVKPGFFLAFRSDLPADAALGAGPAMPPNTTIIIPIEIEEEALDDAEDPDPVLEKEPEDPIDAQQHEQDSKTDEDGEAPHPATDLDAIIGQAAQTIPDNIGIESVVIPPRAVEITWPDTGNLKHCLGHYIDVHILVSENGDILRIEAPRQGYPEDCLEAALTSARQIVFEPGHRDGKPAALWTQVRIEFRRKN